MGRQRDVANLASAIVAVAELDLAVADRFQTAVGDGDAEDVAAQIAEDLLTAAGGLTVNDPFCIPEECRQACE